MRTKSSKIQIRIKMLRSEVPESGEGPGGIASGRGCVLSQAYTMSAKERASMQCRLIWTILSPRKTWLFASTPFWDSPTTSTYWLRRRLRRGKIVQDDRKKACAHVVRRGGERAIPTCLMIMSPLADQGVRFCKLRKIINGTVAHGLTLRYDDIAMVRADLSEGG